MSLDWTEHFDSVTLEDSLRGEKKGGEQTKGGN
jgi:hypothetical protein